MDTLTVHNLKGSLNAFNALSHSTTLWNTKKTYRDGLLALQRIFQRGSANEMANLAAKTTGVDPVGEQIQRWLLNAELYGWFLDDAKQWDPKRGNYNADKVDHKEKNTQLVKKLYDWMGDVGARVTAMNEYLSGRTLPDDMTLQTLLNNIDNNMRDKVTKLAVLLLGRKMSPEERQLYHVPGADPPQQRPAPPVAESPQKKHRKQATPAAAVPRKQQDPQAAEGGESSRPQSATLQGQMDAVNAFLKKEVGAKKIVFALEHIINYLTSGDLNKIKIFLGAPKHQKPGQKKRGDYVHQVMHKFRKRNKSAGWLNDAQLGTYNIDNIETDYPIAENIAGNTNRMKGILQWIKDVQTAYNHVAASLYSDLLRQENIAVKRLKRAHEKMKGDRFNSNMTAAQWLAEFNAIKGAATLYLLLMGGGLIPADNAKQRQRLEGIAADTDRMEAFAQYLPRERKSDTENWEREDEASSSSKQPDKVAEDAFDSRSVSYHLENNIKFNDVQWNWLTYHFPVDTKPTLYVKVLQRFIEQLRSEDNLTEAQQIFAKERAVDIQNKLEKSGAPDRENLLIKLQHVIPGRNVDIDTATRVLAAHYNNPSKQWRLLVHQLDDAQLNALLLNITQSDGAAPDARKMATKLLATRNGAQIVHAKFGATEGHINAFERTLNELKVRKSDTAKDERIEKLKHASAVATVYWIEKNVLPDATHLSTKVPVVDGLNSPANMTFWQKYM